MKIAFANILYSKKHQRGGLGTHIASLSKEFARRGHDVTILTSGEGPTYFENQVRIVPLGPINAFSHARQILNPGYLLRRLAYMIRMTRYVMKEGVDIVEAADGGFEQLFLAAFVRRKCSLVTKLHGNFRLIYSQPGLLGCLAGKAESYSVRRSDAIYASTTQYAASIADAYGIPLGNIKIIPYAIELEPAVLPEAPDLTEQYPSLRGKKLIFLSTGSSPIRKGAPLFLEAAAKCERDDLHFVLSCNDRQFLQETRISPNVLVVRDLNQRQFYDWLRSANVVVFPSSGESFCIAVREAMLFGKAIIVSKSIPFEGLDLEYPNCAVLPSLQSSVLIQAIMRFIDCKLCPVENEYYQRMAFYYGIGVVADQTEQLYVGLRSTVPENACLETMNQRC